LTTVRAITSELSVLNAPASVLRLSRLHSPATIRSSERSVRNGQYLVEVEPHRLDLGLQVLHGLLDPIELLAVYPDQDRLTHHIYTQADLTAVDPVSLSWTAVHRINWVHPRPRDSYTVVAWSFSAGERL
jgi:hypothetical protein